MAACVFFHHHDREEDRLRNHRLQLQHIAGMLLLGLAGAASAQSSATVFGIVDLGVQRIKNGSASRSVESPDGLSSSRLGFRGVEDLGSGLSAGFHLEGAVSADDGAASGFNFKRRSTVSLISRQWGELRLGRDYTPTFWAISVYSPFGTNGVGHAGEIAYGFGGKSSTAPTIVRADNAVGYFLPSNLGGVYGQAMVAAGEGAATGKFRGARLGYAAGPLDVSGAVSDTVNAANGDKFRTWNIGASYDLQFAKLMGFYLVSKQDVRKQTNYLLGAVVPFGQGEFKVSYVRADVANSANDANKIAIGYVYNLSKRTALYTAAARIDNKATAAFVIANGPPLTPGDTSQGIELGIRHSF
jgi:predicted porin